MGGYNMKKKYTLDFSIERDVDRVQAVKNILDQMNTDPSPLELEQMGDYILYGKDENGQNALKRGETIDNNRRYNSFTRISEKNKSLDELLDNPLTDQAGLKTIEEKSNYTKKKPTIKRPKYNKEGECIDPGDSDIPGMQELWDRIDYYERVLAANEGKIPFAEDLYPLKDSYRIYQLRHILIEMRRYQYYLKDSYKPTLHFQNLPIPQPQTYNWDQDSAYWISMNEWERRTSAPLLHTISTNLEDYEVENGRVKWVVRQHTFDWENPRHVRIFIDHYSAIYMQMWDKLFSWGRTLIYDFDRYADMCNFSEVRQYMLLRKIDKASNAQITQELQEKFGIVYNENHLSTIFNREIPEKIAAAAKRNRLLIETPQSECKQCFHCKRFLPRDTLFFGRNNSRKDGWSSNCKECEKKHRIAKGEQGEHDRRNKDAQMY